MPKPTVSMPQQSVLHLLRQRIGSARQHSHAAALNTLQALLDGMGLAHPYELDEDQRAIFMGATIFATGGSGLVADGLDKEFVYRICGIRKTVDFTDWIRPYRFHN